MPRVIGHEVRREQHLHRLAGDVRERQLHLRGVAVREQAVGVDVLARPRRTGWWPSGPRPAPETPDTASTTMPVGSTSPAASSGASASDAVVG